MAASTKSTATPVLVMKLQRAPNHNIGGRYQGGGAADVGGHDLGHEEGMGLIRSMLVMARVMGPMRSTVVTLSRKADKTAVIKANNTISGQGRPLAIFAALMAMYSKMPEFLTTATKKHHADQDPQGVEVHIEKSRIPPTKPR